MEQTMKEIRTKNPLGYQPIGRLLMKFAIPSVISMLVNAVYNIVDQIFIGQGVGYLGNAATTVAFPIVTIILAVGTMLGAGGSAYAAIKLGEKKEEEAENTLGNVFILLVGIGIVLTVIGLVFLDPILTIFGATPKNMGYAKDYASIILLGTVFNLLGIGLSNMARCDGSPNVAMYSMVAGALLNCVLDPIYIFVFHWGVQGAAIATLCSYIVMFLVRVVSARKIIPLQMHGKKLLLGTVLVLLQSAIMVLQTPGWLIVQILIPLLLFLMYREVVIATAKRVLKEGRNGLRRR